MATIEHIDRASSFPNSNHVHCEIALISNYAGPQDLQRQLSLDPIVEWLKRRTFGGTFLAFA